MRCTECEAAVAAIPATPRDEESRAELQFEGDASSWERDAVGVGRTAVVVDIARRQELDDGRRWAPAHTAARRTRFRAWSRHSALRRPRLGPGVDLVKIAEHVLDGHLAQLGHLAHGRSAARIGRRSATRRTHGSGKIRVAESAGACRFVLEGDGAGQLVGAVHQDAELLLRMRRQNRRACCGLVDDPVVVVDHVLDRAD